MTEKTEAILLEILGELRLLNKKFNDLGKKAEVDSINRDKMAENVLTELKEKFKFFGGNTNVNS